MKRIRILSFVLLLGLSSRAGFVLGYQAGTYVPGLANIKSTTYYYNKVYGANFKYNNFFHGVFVGFRFDVDKGWFGMAWHNKHNSFTSDYVNNAETYTLTIKHRMNDLVFDGGYRNKIVGIGCGMDLSNFNVITKRAKKAEYGAAQWGQEYGAPIKLLGLPDNPSFSIIGEVYAGKTVILRGAYHFSIGGVTFANDGALMFYEFRPDNLTFSLLFNFGAK
jgi:hypothetical protein